MSYTLSACCQLPPEQHWLDQSESWYNRNFLSRNHFHMYKLTCWVSYRQILKMVSLTLIYIFEYVSYIWPGIINLINAHLWFFYRLISIVYKQIYTSHIIKEQLKSSHHVKFIGFLYMTLHFLYHFSWLFRDPAVLLRTFNSYKELATSLSELLSTQYDYFVSKVSCSSLFPSN